MIEPSQEYPDAPQILLGGRLWPIPLLAPRQLRIVVPGLMRFYKIMGPVLAKLGDIENTKEVPPELEAMNASTFDLLCEVVAVALSRAHKGFKLDDLLDMPGVTFGELLATANVIARQGGMTKAEE